MVLQRDELDIVSDDDNNEKHTTSGRTHGNCGARGHRNLEYRMPRGPLCL